MAIVTGPRRTLLRPVRGIPRRGLVALYRVDDGSGQVLTDASGNRNNGQLGSTSGSDSNDPTWGTNALTGDGVDDYVNTSLVPGNAGTLAVVAKAVDATTTRVIFGSQNGGSDRCQVMLTSNPPAPFFGVGGATQAGASRLTVGTYHALALTWESGVMTGYVDGLFEVAASYTGNPSGIYPLWLFTSNNAGSSAGPYNGTIAAATVYNVALTAREVRRLFRALRRIVNNRDGGIVL